MSINPDFYSHFENERFGMDAEVGGDESVPFVYSTVFCAKASIEIEGAMNKCAGGLEEAKQLD